MKKQTKGKKIQAALLMIVMLVIVMMVASGSFEFQYGIIGGIGAAAILIWCLVILFSPTYNMAADDKPALRKHLENTMEAFVKEKQIDETSQTMQFTMQFTDTIPADWLERVRKKWAKQMADYEKPLLFYRDNFIKDEKFGVLVTELFLYYRLKNDEQTWKKGRLPIQEIEKIEINRDKLSVNDEYCGNISSEKNLIKAALKRIIEEAKNFENADGSAQIAAEGTA